MGTSLSSFLYSDKLGEARRRKQPPNRKTIEISVLAARSLRSSRLPGAAREIPIDGANPGRFISRSVFLTAAIGITAGTHILSPLGLPAAAIATTLYLLLLIIIRVNLGLTSKVIFGAVVLGWLLLAALSLASGVGPTRWAALAIPPAASLLAEGICRGALIAAKVPLFAPAALIVTLSTLVSQDPWRLSSTIGFPRLAALGASVVLPLLLFATLRFRRLPLEPVLSRTIAGIHTRKEQSTREVVIELRRRCLTVEHWPTSAEVNRRTEGALGSSHRLEVIGNRLLSSCERELRGMCTFRLTGLVLGTSMFTYILAYAVAILAIPASLASEWSASTVTFFTVPASTLGFDLTIPFHPYAEISTLLCILSAVGFIAFCLTEDAYAAQVVDAVFSSHIRRLVLMGTLMIPTNEIMMIPRLPDVPVASQPPTTAKPAPVAPTAASLPPGGVANKPNRTRRRRQKR